MNAAHEIPELDRRRLALGYTCYVSAGTALIVCVLASARHYQSIDWAVPLVAGTLVAQFTAAAIVIAWVESWYFSTLLVWVGALLGLFVGLMTFEPTLAVSYFGNVLLWGVSQIVLQLICLWIPRSGYGVWIQQDDSPQPAWQFGVRHLLIATAAVGLFLGVRIAAPQIIFFFLPPLWILIPPAGAMLLCLAVLLRRNAFLTTGGLLLLLAAMLPPYYGIFRNPTTLEDFVSFASWVTYGVIVAWMMVFALPLRLVGYRMFARGRQS